MVLPVWSNHRRSNAGQGRFPTLPAILYDLEQAILVASYERGLRPCPCLRRLPEGRAIERDLEGIRLRRGYLDVDRARPAQGALDVWFRDGRVVASTVQDRSQCD